MNKIRISTLFEDIFDIQFFKYWMNIEKRRYNKVLKSKMFCNSNSFKTTKLDLFIKFIFRNPRNKYTNLYYYANRKACRFVK